MAYDPRHLLNGENPPSLVTSLLASTLPSWTDARNYPLPPGPGSLTLVNAASAYNAVTQGSHWQRFINAYAIELELLDKVIDDNAYSVFLEYPGRTHRSLDTTYRYALPSTTTVVSASATLQMTYSNQYDINGNQIPSLTRTPTIPLLQCNRLFDFYYGLSQIVAFTSSTEQVILPTRVGVNENGAAAIEWITVNGTIIPSSTYDLLEDQQTISFDSLSVGQSVVIHYTCYDVYYLLQEDLPYIYLRENYPEIWLTVTGALPVSINPPTTIPANTSTVVPTVHMLWNELDEIGLLLSKPRLPTEQNLLYQRRLIDSILYPSGSTLTGIRNALATELMGISHATWGDGAVNNNLGDNSYQAATIAIGNGNVDPNSILINRLPLPYYSVTCTSSGGNSFSLPIPVLPLGQTYQTSIQMIATGGAVVPGLVPFKISSNAPASALPIYDTYQVLLPQTHFQSQSATWYPGTLNVWKNGVPLVSGVDFIEQSQTVFTLTNTAMPNDQLQIGYIYDSSLTELELEAQADVLTDLAPILQTTASYSVDPIQDGTVSFPGWSGRPPDIDPAAVAQYGTWTLTLTITNIGSAPSQPYNLNVTLPPQVTFDGQYLSMSPFASGGSYNLSYIDSDQIWVKNLTDPQLQFMLYTAGGAATPFFKALAADISNVSPLQWGDIRWDRSYWHTANERYDKFGYLPSLLDPDLSSFKTQQALYSGGISNGTVSPTLPGTAVTMTTNLVRYPVFSSGIGDQLDCQVNIATVEQAQTAMNPPAIQQLPLGLATTPVAFSPPTNAAGAMYAMINPGTYYLNQEEHYYFSAPIYAEVQSTNFLLNGALPNVPIVAYINDPIQGLIPMRRVYFLDSNQNPTLTYVDTQTINNNQIATTYENISNIQFLSASDGNTYVLPASASSNVVSASGSNGIDISLSYTLANSFTVLEEETGSSFISLQDSRGILVIYETGSGSQLTALALHPYYNPRQSGFVYIATDQYVPTDISTWVDPKSIPADGLTNFTVKAKVTNTYGTGHENFPVTITVGYREGTVTSVQTTDPFGYVYANFSASSLPQVVPITVTLQLFDGNNNPLTTILGQTYIEMYSGFQ